jgi:hypothetical protein
VVPGRFLELWEATGHIFGDFRRKISITIVFGEFREF